MSNIKIGKSNLKNIIQESIKETLNEISINAKKRNVDNAINIFTKGKNGYNCIKTFGIVSAENPDSQPTDNKTNKKNMHSFSQSLKSSHYVFVRQRGHFGGNDESSYFIVNISLQTLIAYASKYEQTSFFYCELVNDNDKMKVKSSYFEKKDTSLSYNKNSNPYILIESTTEWLDASNSEDYSILGGKFKYVIPLKYFGFVDESINNNIVSYGIKYDVINESINKIGLYPWYLRKKIYKDINIF